MGSGLDRMGSGLDRMGSRLDRMGSGLDHMDYGMDRMGHMSRQTGLWSRVDRLSAGPIGPAGFWPAGTVRPGPHEHWCGLPVPRGHGTARRQVWPHHFLQRWPLPQHRPRGSGVPRSRDPTGQTLWSGDGGALAGQSGVSGLAWGGQGGGISVRKGCQILVKNFSIVAWVVVCWPCAFE